MACHAVQMWSLSGLVAAFLDLTISYFLLCASAAAYLASKFLGFFGLNLPCPCDGMFINVHSRSLCFNRLLVDVPLQKLSDVQLSVRQKFPFTNSISPRKYDGSVSDDNCGIGIIELEGEVSCSSSVPDARGSADVVRREISSRTGKIDMKGKGILSYRPNSRLRHRRGIGSHGKNLSLLSYDPPLHEEVSDSETYRRFSANKRGSWCTGDGSLLTDSEDHYFEYDKAPKKRRGRRRTLSRDEMNLSSDVDTYMNENMQYGEELQYNQQGIQSYDGDENYKIRFLEQALEREHAARAELHVELEKERSAAASAADEAMAMILRLQEEKASIEMESRQYQRIIEEKSAYDDEEMDILQEILIRREKEKLFLEKEVEAYREMVSRGNGQLTGDLSDNNDSIQVVSPLNDSIDDPILKTDNKWTDDVFESKVKSKPASRVESPGSERLKDSNENLVHMSVLGSSGKMAFQKEVISSGKDIQMIPKSPKSPPECKNVIPSHTKELEHAQTSNEENKLEEKVIRTCYGTEKGDLKLDEVPRIYDVHTVDDGIKLRSEETVDKDEQLLTSNSLEVFEAESVQSEPIVKKSSSEVTSGLPPIGRRSPFHSMRRSSMSILDTEMLKIDSEIVQLRERLKHVQQGREKLSFSLENRESRNIQLNILEDIARQIQKVRRLNEPQRSARQASLPPPNSKGISKRRRSRSVSSGFQMSS